MNIIFDFIVKLAIIGVIGLTINKVFSKNLQELHLTIKNFFQISAKFRK